MTDQRLERIINAEDNPDLYLDRPELLAYWCTVLANQVARHRESITKTRAQLEQIYRETGSSGEPAWYSTIDEDAEEQERQRGYF